MAYATIGEVQGLIAHLVIGVASVPTNAQATAINNDTSQEIDVALSAAGLTVPVTTPTYFLDWLGLLNAYGTAAAVLKSAFPDADGAGDNPAYAFWEQRYQDGLRAIRDGSAIPSDAVTGSGFVSPSTYLTRNPDTEESIGTIAEPRFTMGKVF